MSGSRALRHTLALLGAAALAMSGAAIAADMSKTIRTAYIAPETGFDPAASSDL